MKMKILYDMCLICSVGDTVMRSIYPYNLHMYLHIGVGVEIPVKGSKYLTSRVGKQQGTSLSAVQL